MAIISIRVAGQLQDIIHQSAAVDHQLQEIVKNMQQTDQIMQEVAVASGEQNLGLQQVNAGVREMSNLTESNVATSQETASASKNLQEDAQNLRGVISDLMKIIGGKET